MIIDKIPTKPTIKICYIGESIRMTITATKVIVILIKLYWIIYNYSFIQAFKKKE